MVHPLRMMAGGFAGVGALALIFLGEIPAGVAILAAMLGFFIGEANGKATNTAS